MLNRLMNSRLLTSLTAGFIATQSAAAQQPVVYRPPPAVPPAPAGTLPLPNLPSGARDAIVAGLDAMQSWSFAVADEHFAHALSIDSTIGFARVLRIHMRNWNFTVPQFIRGTADAARRGVGEQTVALAFRANGAQAAALFAAAVAMFPNDVRLRLEHAVALAGRARLDSLRSLNLQQPDFAPSRMNLAYFLTSDEVVPEPAVAEEALTAAQEAVRIAPAVAGTHVAFGHVLQRTGRHEEAVQHLSAALRMDPRHAIAYELLADIYIHDGAPKALERARASLDSAAAYTMYSHRAFEIRRHASQLKLHEGNLDEVIAHDTTLIRDAQRGGYTDFASTSWMRLAVLAAIAGQPELIDGFIAEARKVYGTPTAAMLNLEMHANELARRPEEAKRAREAWLATLANSNSVANQNALAMHNAMILIAENKPAEALTECGKVTGPIGSGPELWCQLVRIDALGALGRGTEAQQLQRAVIARNTTPPESLVLATLVYRGRGRTR